MMDENEDQLYQNEISSTEEHSQDHRFRID